MACCGLSDSELKLVTCTNNLNCQKKLKTEACCNICVVLSCSVKYDAYRQHVESMKIAQSSGRSAPSAVKIREVEAALQLHRQRYERLQSDLVIKLKFLEENKVNTQIMNQHIINHVCSFFKR